MQLLQTLSLLALSSAAVAQNCSTGAVVFAVRGSDYNSNSLSTDPAYNQLPSGMVSAATAVVNKAGGTSTGSYYTAVPYPAINPSSANLQSGAYAKSVAIGINETQSLITQYVKKCPEGKIFVMGHSQGAQVVSGALGGCTPGFCTYKGVDAMDRVGGAVVFADPGYVNQVFPIDNKLAGSNNAVSATTNNVNGTVHNNNAQYQFLNTNFAPRFRSFCQSGDKFCNSAYNQTSDEAQTIHDNEPQTYSSAASTFLTALV